MPLVIYYLARAGIVNYRMLSSKRRYAVLAIFIISAMIASVDAVSLVLVALPLWGLYEIGILIAKFFGKKEILYESP
jgi:sec-independent protein translocase protein TatC